MQNLSQERLLFQSELPPLFIDLEHLVLQAQEESSAVADISALQNLFPHTFARPYLAFGKGEELNASPLRVGVVLSGGQAAGGHNVITGLFDALKRFHSDSLLVGFLNGPGGLVENQACILDKARIDGYRNQGGFDMIGSGRTKIESQDQFAATLRTVQEWKLDGLVVIGGDDSNTNAALLAEFFLANNCETSVIGVPKTIDGDLKNAQIEMPFGCDTACRVYSEAIGNICRDSLSAKKYIHFIKLMGRSASHIALECALQTHVNLALIGEEIAEKNLSFNDVIQMVADVIQKRADLGKHYGVILIPEGLLEFIPEFKKLIHELNDLAHTVENMDDINEKISLIQEALSDQSSLCFNSLSPKFQAQLTLDRDPHGNVRVSQIETEQVISEAVKERLGGKLNALHHFFGYEGRCGLPSNFDTQYCYALGFAAATLTRHKASGYMASIQNLSHPVSRWVPSGIPITSMMNIERRHNQDKPVIQKALVNLKSDSFKFYSAHREEWALTDDYIYPGPIQFFGPTHLTDSRLLCLSLDSKKEKLELRS